MNREILICTKEMDNFKVGKKYIHQTYKICDVEISENEYGCRDIHTIGNGKINHEQAIISIEEMNKNFVNISEYRNNKILSLC